ncbi:MAG: LPS export ABC transporter ATP-binding protein [Planctomycetota bacterium]|jgi:lipopolysaccharide export system ATP-binding protein|nr:LPS export ABC transporter ATP-binding protein [Planctomycetota bacterium]
MSNILETKGITKSYKGRTVVSGVDLHVKEGEIVGLLGPNGAGKTTSFRMCMGMVTPDEGSIFLHNEDVTQMPIYQRARRGLGYLAQEASVFRKLSVADNVLAVLETLKLSAAERAHRCNELLEEFGLAHLRDSTGEVLSGGERRRVEIARALATNPKLILLDEPFSGVDPIAVEDIQSILVQLQQKGIAILLTDHNVRETLSITNRAYILSSGTVLAQGTADELVHNNAVRKIYLGQNFELG